MSPSPLFILLLSFLAFIQSCSMISAAQSYPCDYSETVNITDSLRLKDGSYSYDNIIIPAHLTAEYKIKVIDGIAYSTQRHMRGCICRLKPCITFCCPQGSMYDEQHLNCSKEVKKNAAGGYHMGTAGTPTNVATINERAHIEVTNASGRVDIVNIHDAFVTRQEFGCQYKFINKKDENFWKWDLLPNGSLVRDGKLWTTDEYCFTPLLYKKSWSLTPLICERFQRGFRLWIYVICTVLSILVNLFILLLLLSIKDARSGHYGQCIQLYLASMIVGLTALVYLSLKNPANLSHTACRNIGFLAYIAMMLSFLFLNIISWDFWYNFCLKRLTGWKRYVLYALAFVIAFVLRTISRYAQDSKMSRNLKPGIDEDFCWFDTRLWGILIYYYLPIVISLSFSIFCCIKTYFRMIYLSKDVHTVAGHNVRIAKKHFYAFSAYLLAVTCVWLREILVYIGARLRERYFIIDFLSGICILVLAWIGFVCFVYKNQFVRSWWRINVLGEPKDTIFTVPMHSYDQSSADKINGTYISGVVKRNPLFFPIDGFSNLYRALYKCDRVTLDGVRKIGVRTK